MLNVNPAQTKITVSKKELLETLEKNRTEHVKDYNEALEGYRLKRISDLEEALDQVTNTLPEDVILLVRGISWTAPVSHEKDYDRAIRMLTMMIGETVEIDGTSFDNFVMDDWDWKRQTSILNNEYKSFVASASK